MKIWVVVTEEEWAYVGWHVETISAHSTEEAANEAAGDAEEFQRVKVVAVELDGGDSELFDLEYFH